MNGKDLRTMKTKPESNFEPCDRRAICLEALRTYGIEKQSLIVCEELAELTKEVSKAVRKKTTATLFLT